ncbi:MAG: magnesium transporter CorA family protein [SAR324 cluster bacterium]|uniref:Magnesium transporter CorA family protein n=1 Tax=SAR324 cluster bacterium TaxID=2024889 RepID=A0A7X9FU26_9DELT|nr:magnesium transporter CorA family protein [SAR324 cluster bacterium]
MTQSEIAIPIKHFFEVGSGANLKPIATIEEALALYHSGRSIWIDFSKVTRADLEAIAPSFGLHPLAIEDCFDEEQIPKIEDYATNTFLLFNTYKYEDTELQIGEVDIFVGDRFVVSIGFTNPTNTQCFERLEKAFALYSNNLEGKADVLLHIILDYVVDEKVAAIEALQDEMDRSEVGVLDEPSTFSHEMLMKLRRHLMNLRKSLFHEREILVKICRRDSPFISDKAIYHFRDIYDHLAKFYETTEMCRERISNLMEIYFSIQNNKMTMAANKTNQVMRRLTLITTIFMPLTLLAGIGGMSEYTMMTGVENWRMSYLVLFIVMIMVGVVNFWILKVFESKDL